MVFWYSVWIHSANVVGGVVAAGSALLAAV